MRAKDIMTADVVTVAPGTPVSEVAQLLLRHRISGVPVVDDRGRMVGIVSEGDLMFRAEIGTEHHRAWWLRLFANPEDAAMEFVRTHGLRAADVMTRRIVSAGEDVEIGEIARLMEEHRIKRVPILRRGRLVGIVSRADLLRALAGVPKREAAVDDATIHRTITTALRDQEWASGINLNVIVTDGVVQLCGFVESEPARRAIRVAAEIAPGVKRLVDRMSRTPMAYVV